MSSLLYAGKRSALPTVGSVRSDSRQRRLLAIVSLVALSMVFGRTDAAKADEPDFGPHVLVLDPSMANVQSKVNTVYRKQESNQFGSDRYAFLFKPGKYDLDVQMGFYMQAMGLGKSPDNVAISGGVRSMASWMGGNATCNFWRGVENLSVTPSKKANVWAVSQGADLRRTHIKGDLHLWDGGWSSGGFMADCKIDGQVVSGSQQQWFSRNNNWRGWNGGVWNMVFVGDVPAPGGNWPGKPYTVVDKTPVIREKPYLVFDEGKYSVMVPTLATDTEGASWAKGATPATAISIDKFYLAHPGKDNAKSINAALADGKSLLLTPGVYTLEDSIRVTRADTVVLGLGFATLVPSQGNAAIVVSDVDAVTIAGLMIDAGPTNSPALLQVGEPGSKTSHAKAPTFLYDIFCRAGGASEGSADCLVMINSNDVVGDNLWLWRADHGAGSGWTESKNANGLVVNGNDVTMYGLFVEHTQQYQTLWNGNGGRVYFYQSEMPYDPPSADAWKHGSVTGYASYKVADNVTTHQAWGVGVYAYFADASIVAENAVETPSAPGVKVNHVVIIRLNGKENSGIQHAINGKGGPVINTMKATVD